MLDQIKVGKRVVGTKQTLKMVENGCAKMVFLARDVDEDIKSKVESTCEERQVSIFYVDNMDELGRACGINRRAAAAALIDD